MAAPLPDSTHIGTVHLQVSDLPRALSYYQDVIGLKSHTTTAETATLRAHGDQRPIVTLRTQPGVTPARRGAFGLFHFAILVPDRATLGRFAAHLTTLDVRVGMADHLVSEALYLWDPDGLGIEVYADRPRSTWKYRGGELMMTTDPLDTQSVVAAGGGEPWTGMPSGTTIGHMHLHVGDLAQADAFYSEGLGLEKTVWSYPGALFLAAGGYHHHLGTNVWSPGPSAKEHEARLLEWELVVPGAEEGVAVDPWGTQLRIVSA